jgi:hypothetical protein
MMTITQGIADPGSVPNFRFDKIETELNSSSSGTKGALSIRVAAEINHWGDNLTADDLKKLAERWITPELAEASGVRRVPSFVGREMFARKTGDLSGLIIPNVAPWDPAHVREYRLRLDSPPLEIRADGSRKEHSADGPSEPAVFSGRDYAGNAR